MEELGTKLGSPRTVRFKFWRAAHQKVLSGEAKRPIVEKALFYAHGASYNPLDLALGIKTKP